MNLSKLRARARRAPGTARRRAARFATSSPESLEARRLLAAGSFGINVDITPYASYVNWLQQPASAWVNAPGQSNALSLNSSGDPQSDAAALFDDRINQPWNGPDPNAVPPPLSGTYHLSFNGQATIQPLYQGISTPFTVQNQAYNASTNSTTVDLVVPAGNTNEFFGIAFLNTQATPASGTNTGFSNARLIRPGYAANSTQLYTNEFLSALKPYTTLRYLGPNNANGQPVLGGPSNNTLVTVDAPQVDQTGVPWEYLVTLANQTHTDMWINIPQGATNAYVAAVAGIIENGGTVNGVSYAGLDPSLKIYLEYSNEVWGGILSNEEYQNDAVQNNADNHPLSTFPSNLHVYDNVDGSTVSPTTQLFVAAGRRYLERTSDIGQIFQGVFGADPTHQKIRPVLGWQENNQGFYPPALDWFEHFFGPAAAAFYGAGNANYWDPYDYSSVDSVINTLAATETSYAIPSSVNMKTIDTFYNLKYVSYEGGPSIGGTGTAGQVALAASRDPRLEQLVYQHYLDYYASGGDLGMFFAGPFGTWSPQNEWDEAELAQYGNPGASPKYRGTVDVANAAPVAFTAGTHVSASAPTSFSATTDTLGDNFSRPVTGQQAYWLLNAASAGNYDLTMSTNSQGNTEPGQVKVLLNDKQIGGIIGITASSTIDLGNLPLQAGPNTLSIVVVHGTFDPGQSFPYYYQFQPTTFTFTPPSATPPPPPPPPSDPSFVGTDATTQGNWSPTYGGDGYDVMGGGVSLPSYATVTPAGQQSYTWGAFGSDPRAPFVAPSSPSQVASAWYGSSFTVDLNLTDGQAHQVSLYLLDWDTSSRSERVDVVDPATGAVLDSRTASSFHGGEYLTWDLAGHVQLRFTSLAGNNAVLNAIYFGSTTKAAPPPPSDPSFVGTDATTQGNWSPTYGGDGYDVMGGGVSLPSYATVTPAGQQSYTWGAFGSDPRAPFVAPSSPSQVASAWYGSSFTVDLNLTDGQAHQVSLYLLDWDTSSRSERVDVVDPATGAVLDSRTASSFHGGEYLTWDLAGHVQLRFTSLAGNNAVLNAIYFGSTTKG